MARIRTIDALRDNGRRAYENGDIEAALFSIEQCFEIVPGDPRTQELLGLLQHTTGHYSASVSSLETASVEVPLSLAARVCLSDAYGRVGRLQLSYDLLHDLISEERIPVPLLLQVAVGLDQIDRPDASITACRRCIELDPDCAQACYDLGYYIGRCGGGIAEIEPIVRTAIRLDPHRIQYRIGLAGLLSRNDRKAEAHELVRDLTTPEIESIDCSCCLKRIAELYESAHDFRRVVVAQQRLLVIETTQDSDGHC